MSVKNGVEYFEFRDGYAVTKKDELLRVIEGYRLGTLKRRELRLYAARLEEKALHKRSKVDLSWILNCRSGMDGVRRLSKSQIAQAASRLDVFLKEKEGNSSGATQTVAIARRTLRYIAQGRCRSTDAVVLFYYLSRRMRAVREFSRLKPGERYGRFKYGELEQLSGIPRANISRAVTRLKDKGWLNTVHVPKRNENRYGQLFVDGALIAMVGARRVVNRRRRESLAIERNDNAPLHKTTTLINEYPKNFIRDTFHRGLSERHGTRSSREEFERIKKRAEQMRAEFTEEAA